MAFDDWDARDRTTWRAYVALREAEAAAASDDWDAAEEEAYAMRVGAVTDRVAAVDLSHFCGDIDLLDRERDLLEFLYGDDPRGDKSMERQVSVLTSIADSARRAMEGAPVNVGDITNARKVSTAWTTAHLRSLFASLPRVVAQLIASIQQEIALLDAMRPVVPTVPASTLRAVDSRRPRAADVRHVRPANAPPLRLVAA